jgi:hypothetical protein
MIIDRSTARERQQVLGGQAPPELDQAPDDRLVSA